MENNEKIIIEPWWKEGVIIFIRVSAYIAVPVILGLYIGRYLDKKYNTEPYLLILSIFIAFISTMYLIWKEMKKYQNKIEKEENIKK